MSDEDIQLNFGNFSPPSISQSASIQSFKTREKSDNHKRPRTEISLKDIRSGKWQKTDIEKTKAIQEKRNKFNSNSIHSSSSNFPKKTPISQYGPPLKKTKEKESSTQENDQTIDLRVTEQVPNQEIHSSSLQESTKDEATAPVSSTTSDSSIATPKRKNMTARQNIEAEKSTYDKQIKQLAQSISKVKPKVAIYQTVADLPTELDLFSEKSFEDLNLNPKLLTSLQTKLSLHTPTQIQRFAIPVLNAKHDVLIKAQTGSGKTLAYLIPIVNDLLQVSEKIKSELTPEELTDDDTKKSINNLFNRALGTFAIIIAPTRELAIQIYEVLKKLLIPFPFIVPGAIMGGENRSSEKARLRKGISILVATPGRLLDHLEKTQSFRFEKCKWLVLDEADRLLDLGFERSLTSILNILRLNQQHIKRQNVLASATLNRDINRLTLLALQHPVFVSLEREVEKKGIDLEELDDAGESNIPEDEEVHNIPSQLTQHYLVAEGKRKFIYLIAFLRQKLIVKNKKENTETPGAKIIVFFSNCDSVDFYHSLISRIEVGTPWASKNKRQQTNSGVERLIPTTLFKLHGNLSQDVRSSTFQAFSATSSGVLLCTDVAARGLDIPHVNWIVQFDVPSDPASYIHRIGRTARIGTSGDALLLLYPNEEPYLDILKSKKQMTLQELPKDNILRDFHVYLEPNPSNDPLQEISSLQHKIEKVIEGNKQGELKNLAIAAFQSFIRSYATHTKSTKHIFHIKHLHLGHLCRNFGLRDPPSTFASALKSVGLGKAEVQKMKLEIRSKAKKKMHVQNPRHLTASEFSQ